MNNIKIIFSLGLILGFISLSSCAEIISPKVIDIINTNHITNINEVTNINEITNTNEVTSTNYITKVLTAKLTPNLFLADTISYHNPSGRLQKGRLKNITTITNNIIPDITFSTNKLIYLHDNKNSFNVSSGLLANQVVLDGVPFINSIHFYTNGQVMMGTFLSNVTIESATYSNRYYISFYESGQIRLAALANDAIINGITYAASSNDFGTSFHRNGQVAGGRLVGEQEIDEIRYEGTINFYSNGQVDGGFLVGEQEIDGIFYIDFIAFQMDGQVSFGFLVNRSQVIDNVAYTGGSSTSLFEFYTNRQVKRGFLATNHTFDGVTYAAAEGENFNNVTFYPDGTVLSGNLASNHTIDEITYASNESIGFYSNSRKVSIGILNSNHVIEGVNYQPSPYIFFKTNGDLLAGRLATNSTIDGMLYNSNSYIIHNDDGTVEANMGDFLLNLVAELLGIFI